MKKKMILWLIIILLILTTAAISWGPIVSHVEQAKYTVVQSFGDIEVRDYPSMIVAEVEVSGDREAAANKGFRFLAGYIFGDNNTQDLKQPAESGMPSASEKIAMTAPVTQEANGNSWKVRFVMPSSYSMETLPKPNNRAVTLIRTAAKRFIVIRFSGSASKTNLAEHLQKLTAFMQTKQWQALSDPIYAFFNPPWTIPPLRRNEIMIEIKP